MTGVIYRKSSVPLAMDQPVMSACKPVTNAVCWLGIDHCVVFMLYNDAQILHAYTNCHHFSFLLQYTYTGLDQKPPVDNLEWQGNGSK